MWTEFCNKPEDVDYLVFPRLAALAEVAWTQPAHKDWTSFLKGLDAYNEHLTAKGIVYARSMYNIQHTVTPNDGILEVELGMISARPWRYIIRRMAANLRQPHRSTKKSTCKRDTYSEKCYFCAG